MGTIKRYQGYTKAILTLYKGYIKAIILKKTYSFNIALI